MATNFPSALDNGTSLPYPSATNDTNSPSLSSGQSNQNDAVIATETLLGTNSNQTAPVANTVLTSPTTGTNKWQSLTSAFVSSATGTGSFVFSSSPTLSSPTLTSPTISSPTFSNSLGSISTSTITASGVITANAGVVNNSTLSVSGASTLAGLSTSGQASFQTSLAPPSSGASTAGILFSSTASLGLFFGAGAPTFSAAQGSLYVNTTASTTTTRLYINTTGSTTWADFTASA